MSEYHFIGAIVTEAPMKPNSILIACPMPTFSACTAAGAIRSPRNSPACRDSTAAAMSLAAIGASSI